MRVKGKDMSKRKAQTILEYLAVLSMILVGVLSYTFWHYTFQTGIDKGLTDMGQAVEETVDQDLSGDGADLAGQEDQWYIDNPIPEVEDEAI